MPYSNTRRNFTQAGKPNCFSSKTFLLSPLSSEAEIQTERFNFQCPQTKSLEAFEDCLLFHYTWSQEVDFHLNQITGLTSLGTARTHPSQSVQTRTVQTKPSKLVLTLNSKRHPPDNGPICRQLPSISSQALETFQTSRKLLLVGNNALRFDQSQASPITFKFAPRGATQSSYSGSVP